jgi:hypothetical protein
LLRAQFFLVVLECGAGDYIKQWNPRFFVLVGRFLLYYTEKKEDAVPNGAMLLTTVTVTADASVKKVGCYAYERVALWGVLAPPARYYANESRAQ